MNDNIFKHADSIINEAAEEKERQYGNIDESMRVQETIYTLIANDDDDVIVRGYKKMIALKVSRLRTNLKYDTLLDLIAYAGALNNYVTCAKALDETAPYRDPSVD
jgi:hypothetical protein